MFKIGIASVTFRKSSIFDIIKLAKENSLDCIEIGSDVHAPKEDIEGCKSIAEFAKMHGISIISYGSYYRLGEYTDPEAEFSEYLKAAKALGAQNIRIWAGTKGSTDIDNTERARLVSEAKSILTLARRSDLSISFEYHQNTLTDTADSAVRLIEEINEDNIALYWQPNQNFDHSDNLSALKKVLPYVSNIHVFAWDARSGKLIRYPLNEHSDMWSDYLNVIASDRKSHVFLMEFVKNDSNEQFVSDAKTLYEWRKRYV